MPEIIAIPDEGLGNHSYLVELGDQQALLLDPSRDPRSYLAVAEQRGLTLAFSAETHLHADFLSGSRELALQGVRILAPAAGRLEHSHHGLEDREEVDLGGLTLRALATPGHTPEHLSYLLLVGKRPLALFSGGALMPGSAARTDLISAAETESLTRELYRGVRSRFFSPNPRRGLFLFGHQHRRFLDHDRSREGREPDLHGYGRGRVRVGLSRQPG